MKVFKFAIFSIFATGLILFDVPKAMAFEELDAKISMPPAERSDDKPIGYKWIGLRDGKPYTSTLLSRKGNVETRKGSNGCQFSRMRGFAPSMKWSGCAGTDGTQDIKPLEGKIWPLKVGNKFKYDYTGENDTGGYWVGTRQCTVKAQVRVKTGTGEHDTFKVVCEDNTSTRIWYYSPKLKTSVYSFQDHNTRGKTTFEMVSQEFPGSAIQTEKSSPPTTKKASQPTQTVAKETPSPTTTATTTPTPPVSTGDIKELERKLEYLKEKQKLDAELQLIQAKLKELNKKYSDVK